MTTLRNSRLFSTLSVVSQRNDGRFPFIQNFQKFGNSGKWYRNVPESFQKFRKLLNFRNANQSTENSRNPGSKVECRKKTPGKNFSKIWENLAGLSSFVEILENAFQFTTGSCRKFKADVLVEWKAPDVWETSAVIAVHLMTCHYSDVDSPDWLK